MATFGNYGPTFYACLGFSWCFYLHFVKKLFSIVFFIVLFKKKLHCAIINLGMQTKLVPPPSEAQTNERNAREYGCVCESSHTYVIIINKSWSPKIMEIIYFWPTDCLFALLFVAQQIFDFKLIFSFSKTSAHRHVNAFMCVCVNDFYYTNCCFVCDVFAKVTNLFCCYLHLIIYVTWTSNFVIWLDFISYYWWPWSPVTFIVTVSYSCLHFTVDIITVVKTFFVRAISLFLHYLLLL